MGPANIFLSLILIKIRTFAPLCACVGRSDEAINSPGAFFGPHRGSRRSPLALPIFGRSGTTQGPSFSPLRRPPCRPLIIITTTTTTIIVHLCVRAFDLPRAGLAGRAVPQQLLEGVPAAGHLPSPPHRRHRRQRPGSALPSAALAPPASSSSHRHSRVTHFFVRCGGGWWWAAAVQEMLSELQLKSIDELVHKTVPANILREPLNFNETGTAI